MADAVRRSIEVVPDGRRVEQVASGTLRQPAEFRFEVPERAIEGSVSAFVKIYPSSFSQLVEGLDAIFQMPFGCFEQTSSTTYPNVLALDYLRRTNKSVPAVEAKARQYIHLGYQRLLSFEIAGGGFDWFGRPPANRTLTAYGLMEFEDMARVHDVDPELIERSRTWLLGQQRPDGTWDPERHRLHEDPTRSHGTRLARLSTTAYIAGAVFRDHENDPKTFLTMAYLQGQKPEALDDPYTVALVARALQALNPREDLYARPWLQRLDALKKTSNDGKFVWWGLPTGRQTLFFGADQCGAVDTTALACQALIAAGRDPETTRKALSWLIAQKDARGTWGSTQATVQALKALLAGTGKPLGGDRPRRLALTLDGQPLPDIEIPADQADVLKQIDLSDRVQSGTHLLTIADRSEAESGYQVVFRYHEPAGEIARPEEPLTIQLDYDRATLAVDDTATATATVTNHLAQAAPMVILDLPIPAGFVPVADDLAALTNTEAIEKVQTTPRQLVVYLRDLAPGKPVTLRYRLRATMPVKLSVPAARAYEYYDPTRQGLRRRRN